MGARILGVLVIVVSACAPDSPSRDAAIRDTPPAIDSKLVDAKLPDAYVPDAPPEVINCSVNDLQCPISKYMMSCGGGKCFADQCCCPTSRQCRAGSFPVCCPEGEVCKNTASGTCGAP